MNRAPTMPSFMLRRRAREMPPLIYCVDVILKDAKGNILTVRVDIDADTPLRNLLRTAAIGAFCQCDMTSGSVQAITLRTTPPPPLSAFDLLMGDA